MEDLKKQRIARGLSMRELAKLAGVHYLTINNIEKGKCKISDITKYKLEEYFKNN